MQRATFAITIPHLFSPNFAFSDKSKSHISNITCITFQSSRNVFHTIIKSSDFQSYLFLNTKINWIPPESEVNLLSRPIQSSERAQNATE